MTEYAMPPPPDVERVWLLDHPTYGGPLLVEHDTEAPIWHLHRPGQPPARIAWHDLLALGTVTDIDPKRRDLPGLAPGPWAVHDGALRDRRGTTVLIVPSGKPRHVTIAETVRDLVNAHLARNDDADDERCRRVTAAQHGTCAGACSCASCLTAALEALTPDQRRALDHAMAAQLTTKA
ncbi:MAG: hypothetical protein L0H84_21820, partial [Pseudonocardia sp.]|nr:hypothetical protein [Pseudonocardia sp.]